MKKSIILMVALATAGQALIAGGFAEQAEQFRMQQEKDARERAQNRQQMKENIRQEATAAYKAAEYKIGIRVINTASSWNIEVKDPISFGKWILLPKATSPLSEGNVCYVTALKDFKVRVVDQKTQQPVAGSEMTITRGKGQDIFAINVRSVSAGHKTPTISFEAFSAENARKMSKFNDLDL